MPVITEKFLYKSYTVATFSRDFGYSGTIGNISVIRDIFPINLGSPFTHIGSKIDSSVIIYVQSMYKVSKLILILFWSIYLVSLSVLYINADFNWLNVFPRNMVLFAVYFLTRIFCRFNGQLAFSHFSLGIQEN